MQLFFHVKMASGMDRGCVRPTTTMTTTSHKMAALLLSPANTNYWFTAYFFDI